MQIKIHHIGLAGAALLIGLGLLRLGSGGKNKEYSAVARDAAYAFAKNWNTKDIAARIDPEMPFSPSAEIRLISSIEGKLGRLESIQDVHITATMGGVIDGQPVEQFWATVQGAFEKRPATLQIAMAKRGEEWFVDNFDLADSTVSPVADNAARASGLTKAVPISAE